MTEKIVLTLTKHPLWDFILQPVLVEENEYGKLTILEYADSRTTGFSELDDAAQKLVQLSEKISDTALMETYINPKEKIKTVAVFHKKVKPETTEAFIRPFIETVHHEMLVLLRQSQLPFYVRENVKIRNLYESDRAEMNREASKVVFHFQKQEGGGILYSLRIHWQDEEIDLLGQPHILLCNEPAALLMGNRLLQFDNIDYKKLKPFFTKEEIEIPASYEATYLRTFVKNCLENNEVVTDGIDVQEIIPDKKANLNLMTDSENQPVIKLSFQYQETEYPLDHGCKKVVQTVDRNGSTSLTWFQTDSEWEQSLVEKLEKTGMVKDSSQNFTLKNNKTEYLVVKQMGNLMTWMEEYKEVLNKLDIHPKFEC